MMSRSLKWLGVLAAAFCLLCGGNALAEDTRFDCDCTDIHMHLMPKNGNHGCFAPTCGLEHAHDYTTYSCFDFDTPTCGKESKLHEVTCFTEEAHEAIIQFILQGRKAAFQLIGPISPCHGAVGGLFIQKHLMHADGLIGQLAQLQAGFQRLNRHQLAGIFLHAGNGCQKALIFHGQAKNRHIGVNILEYDILPMMEIAQGSFVNFAFAPAAGQQIEAFRASLDPLPVQHDIR